MLPRITIGPIGAIIIGLGAMMPGATAEWCSRFFPNCTVFNIDLKFHIFIFTLVRRSICAKRVFTCFVCWEAMKCKSADPPSLSCGSLSSVLLMLAPRLFGQSFWIFYIIFNVHDFISDASPPLAGRGPAARDGQRGPDPPGDPLRHGGPGRPPGPPPRRGRCQCVARPSLSPTGSLGDGFRRLS